MSDRVELHEDERRILRERLVRRTERVMKMARLNAPEVVLSMMLVQVFKTALPLCGPSFMLQIFDWLRDDARERAGICRFCGAANDDPKRGMCKACWDQLEQEDRDILLDDADERNPM